MRLLLTCLSLFSCQYLVGEELYLLQASPHQPSSKTKLWSTASGNLSLRQRIVRDGVVIDNVRYDAEARLLAFSFPFWEPRSLEVIRMDNPAQRNTIKIDNRPATKRDRLTTDGGLLDLPDRGLFYPFFTVREGVATDYFGIDVKSLNPARQLFDRSADSHYRSAGQVTFETYAPQMRFSKEGGPVFPPDVEPLFPFPSQFSAGVDPATTYVYIQASTPHIFAVTRSVHTDLKTTEPETTNLWVRVQATGEWRTVIAPGNAPAVRVFGRRLAIAARSLLTDRRPEVNGAITNFATYERYRLSDYEYPGSLLIHDAADGRQWKIETGDSDSEILLIRGDEVYYRIHTKLIRARLDKGGVVKTEQVMDDREEIAEMHWAFFGPDWPGNDSAISKAASAKDSASKPLPTPEPKVVSVLSPGVYYRYSTGRLLRGPRVEDLPAVVVRNRLQVWFVKDEVFGYDHYVGPFDDDDLVERLTVEFRDANTSFFRTEFPKPK